MQNVRALKSLHPVNHPNEQKQFPDDSTAERQSSNQTRERTFERAEEPPTQRPRLENPASSIRWSRVEDPGHWVPAATVEDEEDMWTKTDPEVLWQQQVDDHIWENNGKPACLCQEEWDELFSKTCENITAKVCFCKSEFTGLTATRMIRGDELTRHMVPKSEWTRFFFTPRWQSGRPSWILLQSRSSLRLQQKTYASICPTESFIRDMFIVKSPVKVLEQRQKPSVGGVFLVIVIQTYDMIQTYDSLNDLLQHHKHPQFTRSCFLQQSSNAT